MIHIIYPCDLDPFGQCPKDSWGCGHDCQNCKPTIVEEEEE